MKLECGPMLNVMANLPNTDGTLFSTPQFPAAGASRSDAANIGERKTLVQSDFCTWQNSIRRQEPPNMYT